MPKAQIEIDIPDGQELVKVTHTHDVGSWECTNGNYKVVAHVEIEIRPAWQWPSWLKAAAIVRTCGGTWMACDSLPRLDDRFDNWIHAGRYCMIDQTILDFTPPPCTDYRQSLRLNPNREVKS